MVASTTEPALGAIRMAWWRERLEELDTGTPPPGEPRLSAIARQLLGRGASGNELSKLEDAWLPLLQPFPWREAQAEGLKLRGRILFAIGARLLGGEPGDAQAAGAFWSLLDGVLHCSDAQSANFLFSEAKAMAMELPPKIPRVLRPLTVLAATAVPAMTDPTSGLARGMAAVQHRTTGRIARL